MNALLVTLPEIISSYHRTVYAFDNLYQRSSKTWYSANRKSCDTIKSWRRRRPL